MVRKAIYAGSFDPPTLGHVNIVKRGLKIFDKIIIAVAINTTKSPFLPLEERTTLLKKIFHSHKNIEIDCFEGLLVKYAKNRNCNVLLRGIRTVADFEYELQMSFANKKLWEKLETIFIMTESHFSHISSSIIKEISKFKGSLKDMVPPEVEHQLKEKLKNKR